MAFNVCKEIGTKKYVSYIVGFNNEGEKEYLVVRGFAPKSHAPIFDHYSEAAFIANFEVNIEGESESSPPFLGHGGVTHAP